MNDMEILNIMADIERRQHDLRQTLLQIEQAQAFLVVLGIAVIVLSFPIAMGLWPYSR